MKYIYIIYNLIIILLQYYIALCNEDNVFTIKTEGCVIPQLKPFGEDVKDLINDPFFIRDCSRDSLDLLDNNNTHIWVKAKNLDFFNIDNSQEFYCCYKNFSRILFVLEEPNCTSFNDVIKVAKDHEFVQVDCYYEDVIIYTNLFPFAPKKPLVKTRLQTKRHHDAQYNIILIGFDSLSRMSFHRTMPKTAHYLKNKGAIDFKGYNKLGENSLPNLLPMFTGMDMETALEKGCLENSIWPTSEEISSKYRNNCSLLWDRLKEAGYFTATAADSSVGMFERHFTPEQAQDYYLDPFILQSTKRIGHNDQVNYYICMGTKHYYKVLLDYIDTLTNTLKKDKLFGVFWEESTSHDFLNGPMIMDDDYLELLKALEKKKYLDKSIIIFFSDHGFRFGKIIYTTQGRLESRLPLLSILVPKSFRKKYKMAYHNLKENGNQLTTPFDIHETLLDLLNVRQLENRYIKFREAKYDKKNNLGQSLFLKLPRNRTCQSAGIKEHWCTCYKGKQILADNLSSKEASKQLLLHINKLIAPYNQCQNLTLQDIIVVLVTRNKYDNAIYSVTISVSPSGAIFDATLHQKGKLWAVSGTVSRLDIYGEQGSCLNDSLLRIYCHCQ